MIPPGEIVDGRFEVLELLGEGGLAQVYKVRHTALGSVFALKLLSWRKQRLAERLLLEGRIQAQLNHPNIVAVTDVVRHDGQFGLLMEYVPNESLESWLGRHGGLGVTEGLALFAPILAAVTAAHDAGVLHRDLKPANVLIAITPRGPVPKVTDFGIAKVIAELAEGSTAVGATMGTPGYLAPEQVEDSSTIDARADVFALGAICWEMITGGRAFADAEGRLNVNSTVQNTPRPVADYAPDVPPHIDAAIAKAMARAPDDRFANCRAFAAALYRDAPDLLQLIEGQESTITLSLSGVREALTRTLRTPPTSGGSSGAGAPIERAGPTSAASTLPDPPAVPPRGAPAVSGSRRPGARAYRIVETLGRGSFGTVYRAHMTTDGGFAKDVALKLINANHAEAEEVAARHRDEARLLGLVRHRAILQVDGLVRLNGTWAVVMEYVDGANLHQVLRDGPFPPSCALAIASEVAGALAVAGEARSPDGGDLHIVHRDIKPSNLQLSAAGEVKVLDFGVAQARFATREAATEGLILGTVRYMAPERLEGIESPAGDIYALGVVLAELLVTDRGTGHGTVESLLKRLRAALSATDPELLALVEDCVAEEPGDRPDARTLEQRAWSLAQRYPTPRLTTWAAERVPKAQQLVRAESVADPLSGQTLHEELDSETLLVDPPEASAPPAGSGVARAGAAAAFLGLGGLAAAVLLTAVVALAWFGSRGTSAVDAGGAGGVVSPVEVRPVDPVPTPPTPVPPQPPEPAPVAPEPVVPEPAAPEPVAPVSAPDPVAPQPVASTTRPQPQPVSPEPSVVSTTPPEPAPEPLPPAPEPVAPEPAVAEPVAPVVAVVVPAPPNPAPEPTARWPSVAGTWTGKANNIPLTLEIGPSDDGTFTGTLRLGIPPRVETLRGSVAADGALQFEAADLVFVGAASSSALFGTYRRGSGKSLAWEARR